jgi:hypothetical protein
MQCVVLVEGSRGIDGGAIALLVLAVVGICSRTTCTVPCLVGESLSDAMGLVHRLLPKEGGRGRPGQARAGTVLLYCIVLLELPWIHVHTAGRMMRTHNRLVVLRIGSFQRRVKNPV